MRAKVKNRRTKAKHIKRSKPYHRGHDPLPLDETALLAQVNNLAEPLCASEGLELVYIEFQNEPVGRILRIYIDKPGGVTLNDCMHVSRQLSDLLDVGIGADWAYKLEVSSPGADRPLGKPHDFDRFKGEHARIKMTKPICGQKTLTGILAGTADGMVTILVNDTPVSIPWQRIKRARLINNGEMECL